MRVQIRSERSREPGLTPPKRRKKMLKRAAVFAVAVIADDDDTDTQNPDLAKVAV